METNCHDVRQSRLLDNRSVTATSFSQALRKPDEATEVKLGSLPPDKQGHTRNKPQRKYRAVKTGRPSKRGKLLVNTTKTSYS